VAKRPGHTKSGATLGSIAGSSRARSRRGQDAVTEFAELRLICSSRVLRTPNQHELPAGNRYSLGLEAHEFPPLKLAPDGQVRKERNHALVENEPAHDICRTRLDEAGDRVAAPGDPEPFLQVGDLLAPLEDGEAAGELSEAIARDRNWR
jgi:hypothetical protein